MSHKNDMLPHQRALSGKLVVMVVKRAFVVVVVVVRTYVGY